MRSTSGLSRLRLSVERIISTIQGPQENVVFVEYFPYYSGLSPLIAKVNGIKRPDCEVNSHLEKASVFVRAMYVSRHKEGGLR